MVGDRNFGELILFFLYRFFFHGLKNFPFSNPRRFPLPRFTNFVVSFLAFLFPGNSFHGLVQWAINHPTEDGSCGIRSSTLAWNDLLGFKDFWGIAPNEQPDLRIYVRDLYTGEIRPLVDILLTCNAFCCDG